MVSYYLRLAELQAELRDAWGHHANSDVFFGLTRMGKPYLPNEEFNRLRDEYELECLHTLAEVENRLFDLECVRGEGWFDAEVRVHTRVLMRRERVAKLKAVGAWYSRSTESEFGWRYTVDASGNGLDCRYCGCSARGWDHVPALAVVARMSEPERDATDCRVVRCCSACNARLSRHDLPTVGARLAYLQAPRMARKRRKEVQPTDK